MDRKRRPSESVQTQKTPKRLKKSPQKYHDLSLSELAVKFKELREEDVQLDREIKELESQNISSDLQPLMKALHDYNEMKDLAQMILGYLANAECVTVGELHDRYNLPLD